MTLLNEVDKPGSDVEVYARGLDRVLLKKMKIISDLRDKLLNFYSHLKTEEHMSKLFERNQEMAGYDDDQEPSADTTAANTIQMGNLVDDILNGAYENEGTHNDNLLDEDENAIDDIEHLNWWQIRLQIQ